MAFPLLNSIRVSFYTGPGLTPDEFAGLDNYRALFLSGRSTRRVHQCARQHRRVLRDPHARSEHARTAVRRTALVPVPRAQSVPRRRLPAGHDVGDRRRVPVDALAEPTMGHDQQGPRRDRARFHLASVARRHHVRPSRDRDRVELAVRRSGDHHLSRRPSEHPRRSHRGGGDRRRDTLANVLVGEAAAVAAGDRRRCDPHLRRELHRVRHHLRDGQQPW